MTKQRGVGRIYEKNTVERAIKTEIDARMGEKKGAGKLSWFMSKT